MSLLKCMLMGAALATSFRDRTAEADERLDPRLVDAGPYAGQYILPERLKRNEAFTAFSSDFDALEVVDLDTDVAWPPAPEEDEENEEQPDEEEALDPAPVPSTT